MVVSVFVMADRMLNNSPWLWFGIVVCFVVELVIDKVGYITEKITNSAITIKNDARWRHFVMKCCKHNLECCGLAHTLHSAVFSVNVKSIVIGITVYG